MQLSRNTQCNYEIEHTELNNIIAILLKKMNGYEKQYWGEVEANINLLLPGVSGGGMTWLTD